MTTVKSLHPVCRKGGERTHVEGVEKRSSELDVQGSTRLAAR
jgi:hypothetical protein